MFGWFSKKSEEERLEEEMTQPSDIYTERAKTELAEAAALSDEDLDAAETKVERDFLRKFVRAASRLNHEMAVKLLMAFYAIRDPAVPASAKAGFVAVLLYFINPFDLIPDLTPVVGYLDDAGVLAAAWVYLSGYVTEEHRALAEAYLAAEPVDV